MLFSDPKMFEAAADTILRQQIEIIDMLEVLKEEMKDLRKKVEEINGTGLHTGSSSTD